MLKYILLWFPMLILAIGNGFLRESLIKKYTSDFTAQQLSTVTLILLFAIYIKYVIKQWPPDSPSQAILVGLFWLLLTLTFEFGFGRWRGSSWTTLLGEYNVAKGKLWALVPVWVFIAPYLFYRLLGLC